MNTIYFITDYAYNLQKATTPKYETLYFKKSDLGDLEVCKNAKELILEDYPNLINQLSTSNKTITDSKILPYIHIKENNNHYFIFSELGGNSNERWTQIISKAFRFRNAIENIQHVLASEKLDHFNWVFILHASTDLNENKFEVTTVETPQAYIKILKDYSINKHIFYGYSHDQDNGKLCENLKYEELVKKIVSTSEDKEIKSELKKDDLNGLSNK